MVVAMNEMRSLKSDVNMMIIEMEVTRTVSISYEREGDDDHELTVTAVYSQQMYADSRK